MTGYLTVIRRTMCRALLVFAAVAVPGWASAAGTYPDRPIHLVVGYPPGGTTDLIARVVAQQLSKQMGQSVIVDNRAGAGGSISAEYVAKAPPDGYTLLLSVIGIMSINPSLYKSLAYDPIKDFAPVSQLTSIPQVMLLNPKVPAKNLKEFIAYAKQRPGQIDYGSGGIGTATNLAGELFNSMAGVKLVHVPYRGSAPAMTDLLAGRVSVMFEQIATALPRVRSNSLRALGVTTLKRSPAAPDIPSLSEAGLKGYDMSTWHGISAPAGTPPAIIDRLHQEVVKALASPAVRDTFAKAGVIPVSSTPKQYAAYTKAELIRWRDVIKAAGIKPE